MFSTKKIGMAVLPAVFLLMPFQSFAQISLSVENMALGGGGTTYLTGYETLFVNPANLYIQEKNYTLQVSLLQGAGYYDSQLAVNSPTQRFKRYSETFYPYDNLRSNRFINQENRSDIINRNFSEERLMSNQQSKADIYWMGLKWTREKRSYAFALRTRISSRTGLGRGFFSDEPVEINEGYRIDQSFNQQYQSLHELSFGYAESFTLLNGLIPQLSEFIIGIAPKIVISGSYLNTNFLNRYNIPGIGSGWIHEQKFTQQSTGYFSETNDAFYHTNNLPGFTEGSLGDLLRPSGIGMGLDIGITYLITFGDDFSTLRRQDVPTEKSLRFSFSITDLGAVYQYEKPLYFETEYSTREAETPGPVSELLFAGSPGEHLFFLDQNEEHPLRSAETRNPGSFDTTLPASMQAGALFQINRLKLMGDFSYALSNSAFSSSGLVSYFGVELRPLSFLPLRAGTRLSTDLPGYYSFGAGIETSFFDLNAAVQLKNKSIGPTSEIAGASIVGFKFYIP
ncbi:MAG: DUF5723 family protein [Balneolaceae bacterium]